MRSIALLIRRPDGPPGWTGGRPPKRRTTRGWSLAVFGGMYLFMTCQLANADLFILKDGTRVEGVLLNPDESPREQYQLKLASGEQRTLNAEDVARFQPDRPEKRRYQQLLPKMPATADGNWKMAEWCRTHRLSKLRKFHLEEAVRLDPTHEAAHKALDHVLVDDAWVERDEHMKDKGFIRFRGKWALPQEVAIYEQGQKQDAAAKQWTKTLNMWRKGLDDPDRFDEAWAQIAQITDPEAAVVLIDKLNDERDARLRRLYLDVLSRLEHPAVGPLMIRLAIVDADEELRQACLEKLPAEYHHAAVDALAAALSSKDPTTLRNAAQGLRVLAEPRVIPQLIDALVSTRRWQTPASSPGQLGVSFGSSSDGSSGLGSFGVGGRSQTVERTVQNREVLDALLAVSEGANFGYDQAAWRQWLVASQTPTNLNLRRRD